MIYYPVRFSGITLDTTGMNREQRVAGMEFSTAKLEFEVAVFHEEQSKAVYEQRKKEKERASRKYLSALSKFEELVDRELTEAEAMGKEMVRL